MSGRILIADDVATNRIIMKVKLSAASYDVVLAESGSKALQIASHDPPDLFILDMAMAGVDGISVCRSLRESATTSSVPVIMVGEAITREARLAALDAGADDFLPKPIDETTLLARVRNLLRFRAIREELARRQGTALELGFCEAATPFARSGRVALVAPRPSIALQWQHGLRGKIPGPVEILARTQVLETLGRGASTPDLIVISAESDRPEQGLTMLAELRSRNHTRHAAIIVVHDPDDKQSAVAALDMGANDLLTSDCDPAEMALRIQNQLQRKLQADALRDTVEDGLKLAMIDPLTGLYNRRYALPHMARIAASSKASGRSFAIMVLDLDHFKRINDTFGHSAGDEVIGEVSRRVKDNLRAVDLVARIGGEEFLVVMPETGLAEARAAAERLRTVVAETSVRLATDGREIPVTLSIGVSIGGNKKQRATSVQTLVDQADRALMGAKSEGRNQVTFGKTIA